MSDNDFCRSSTLFGFARLVDALMNKSGKKKLSSPSKAKTYKHRSNYFLAIDKVRILFFCFNINCAVEKTLA